MRISREARIPRLHVFVRDHCRIGKHLRIQFGIRIMNLRQEVTRIMNDIESDKLPCTEAAREIGKALSDPDIGDGCSIIEVCHNDPVLDYDSEPF